MFVLLGAALAVSSTSRAQYPWSGILSPNRAIDWSKAGLPASFTDKGGTNVETTPNPWTPPTRTQYGSTIMPSGNAATDLSNINTALANCTDGTYVLLGPGTFLIQGTITMYQHSCTLRGSGPMSTTLSVSGSAQINMTQAWGGGRVPLLASPAAGASTLTIADTYTPPTVGSVAAISQCDQGFNGTPAGIDGTSPSPCAGTYTDNGGIWVCGLSSVCDSNGGSGQGESQFQIFTISSVTHSGSTYIIGISPSVFMSNWSTSQNVTMTWNDFVHTAVGVGLEDFSLVSATPGEGHVDTVVTYASWVKGVRFLNTGVSVGTSAGFLMANNYVFANTNVNSTYITWSSCQDATNSLFINNLVVGSIEMFEGMGGNVGDVFAFNFSRDGTTGYPGDISYDHHAFDSFILWEGNELGGLDEDDTWGTHALDTYFRNYASCTDLPYSTWSDANTYSFDLNGWQRFMNVIGNAFGSNQCPGYLQTHYGWGGTIYQIPSTNDALTVASLMRWGNVSTVTQSTDTPANSGVRFVSAEVPNSTNMPSSTFPNAVTWQNPTPTGNTLPISFFGLQSSAHPNGGTGLSWWRVCTLWSAFPTTCASTQTQPFPIAGPDISGGPYVNGYAYDIPAKIAWLNLPVDSTYQNSYAISSSSWASGTETLTFATGVLPSSKENLMGAFQLRGVNTACTMGATINAANEILMTGSSTTTVQYALAANPGVSCTGTMKFPDVRQFDERVYQADPASTQSQPLPPSGATGTVSPQS
jgi:hypothetical protein